MGLLDQAEHGCSKCGRKCDSCDKFELEKTFVYHAARAKFKIRRDSTCNTKNVIYLVYYKQCSKQGACYCIEWKLPLRN